MSTDLVNRRLCPESRWDELSRHRDFWIANAAHDATYMLAEVEVVATYKLASINVTP
jgi:hypothetical protein